MRSSRPLNERVQAAAVQLAQLQARQRLGEQAERARTKKREKRERAKTLAALMRSADAHRKIVLGGVVIAAGVDDLDPAELCGWLLTMKSKRVSRPDMADAMRERGLNWFNARELERAQP